MLVKDGEEDTPVPSKDYLPCLGSPLGLGTDTLVEGLICLDFLRLTKNKCRFNMQAWDDFKTQYKLGNLLEVTCCNLMVKEGGKGTIMSSWETRCVAMLRNASQK